MAANRQGIPVNQFWQEFFFRNGCDAAGNVVTKLLDPTTAFQVVNNDIIVTYTDGTTDTLAVRGGTDVSIESGSALDTLVLTGGTAIDISATGVIRFNAGDVLDGSIPQSKITGLVNELSNKVDLEAGKGLSELDSYAISMNTLTLTDQSGNSITLGGGYDQFANQNALEAFITDDEAFRMAIGAGTSNFDGSYNSLTDRPTTITTEQATEIALNTLKNSYPAADAGKLSGIEAGAEVNVQANWTEGDVGNDGYIQHKPNVIDTGNYTVESGTITLTTDGGTGSNVVITGVGTGMGSGSQGPQGRYDVNLFTRAASNPGTPTDVIWTAATNALTGANTDGWSLMIPTGTDDLWEVTATFDPAGTATTITSWSAPFMAGSQGPAGATGATGPRGFSINRIEEVEDTSGDPLINPKVAGEVSFYEIFTDNPSSSADSLGVISVQPGTTGSDGESVTLATDLGDGRVQFGTPSNANIGTANLIGPTGPAGVMGSRGYIGPFLASLYQINTTTPPLPSGLPSDISWNDTNNRLEGSDIENGAPVANDGNWYNTRPSTIDSTVYVVQYTITQGDAGFNVGPPSGIFAATEQGPAGPPGPAGVTGPAGMDGRAPEFRAVGFTDGLRVAGSAISGPLNFGNAVTFAVTGDVARDVFGTCTLSTAVDPSSSERLIAYVYVHNRTYDSGSNTTTFSAVVLLVDSNLTTGFSSNINAFLNLSGVPGVQGAAGTAGAMGDQGFQGLSRIDLYNDDETVTTPPQGVIINTSDFSFSSIPAGWTSDFGAVTAPSATSFAIVNPAAFTGATYTIPDRSWATPFQSGSAGPAGPQGPQGAQGPTGPQGPAGMNGMDGTNGMDGAAGPGYTNLAVSSDGDISADAQNGATAFVTTNIRGPQGPVGPQGPAGTGGDVLNHTPQTIPVTNGSPGQVVLEQGSYTVAANNVILETSATNRITFGADAALALSLITGTPGLYTSTFTNLQDPQIQLTYTQGEAITRTWQIPGEVEFLFSSTTGISTLTFTDDQWQTNDNFDVNSLADLVGFGITQPDIGTMFVMQYGGTEHPQPVTDFINSPLTVQDSSDVIYKGSEIARLIDIPVDARVMVNEQGSEITNHLRSLNDEFGIDFTHISGGDIGVGVTPNLFALERDLRTLTTHSLVDWPGPTSVLPSGSALISNASLGEGQPDDANIIERAAYREASRELFLDFDSTFILPPDGAILGKYDGTLSTSALLWHGKIITRNPDANVLIIRVISGNDYLTDPNTTGSPTTDVDGSLLFSDSNAQRLRLLENLFGTRPFDNVGVLELDDLHSPIVRPIADSTTPSTIDSHLRLTTEGRVRELIGDNRYTVSSGTTSGFTYTRLRQAFTAPFTTAGNALNLISNIAINDSSASTDLSIDNSNFQINQNELLKFQRYADVSGVDTVDVVHYFFATVENIRETTGGREADFRIVSVSNGIETGATAGDTNDTWKITRSSSAELLSEPKATYTRVIRSDWLPDSSTIGPTSFHANLPDTVGELVGDRDYQVVYTLHQNASSIGDISLYGIPAIVEPSTLPTTPGTHLITISWEPGTVETIQNNAPSGDASLVFGSDPNNLSTTVDSVRYFFLPELGGSHIEIQEDGVVEGEAIAFNFGEGLDVSITDGVATVTSEAQGVTNYHSDAPVLTGLLRGRPTVYSGTYTLHDTAAIIEGPSLYGQTAQTIPTTLPTTPGTHIFQFSWDDGIVESIQNAAGDDAQVYGSGVNNLNIVIDEVRYFLLPQIDSNRTFVKALYDSAQFVGVVMSTDATPVQLFHKRLINGDNVAAATYYGEITSTGLTIWADDGRTERLLTQNFIGS